MTAAGVRWLDLREAITSEGCGWEAARDPDLNGLEMEAQYIKPKAGATMGPQGPATGAHSRQCPGGPVTSQ